MIKGTLKSGFEFEYDDLTPINYKGKTPAKKLVN